MKCGTTINAVAVGLAATLGSSPQYPGILRQDRRDQAVAGPIIAIPSVKAHSRKIRGRWSGKRKDRTETYRGRELKDTEVRIGLHSITGMRVRTLAACTLLANTAMLTTTTTTITTTIRAGGTIMTSSLWKQLSAAPEQASSRTQFLRRQ